jgi:hypothetical protein
MNIIKKVMGENKRSWDSKIKYALWADRITTKTSTGRTQLVYVLEAKLPMNLQIPILCFAQQSAIDGEAIQV